jgi:SnoaL-like domain
MRDIRTLLEALCEAFNAHDLDAIMAYFADDCVLEMPRGPDPWGARSEGKKAVREALAGRFLGLPDVPLRRCHPFRRCRHWHLEMDPHRHHSRGPPGQGERLRLLYVSRRAGGAQGFLLEDRRLDDALVGALVSVGCLVFHAAADAGHVHGPFKVSVRRLRHRA